MTSSPSTYRRPLRGGRRSTFLKRYTRRGANRTLTANDVQTIKTETIFGATLDELHSRFPQVGRGTIRQILRGETWRWVTARPTAHAELFERRTR